MKRVTMTAMALAGMCAGLTVVVGCHCCNMHQCTSGDQQAVCTTGTCQPSQMAPATTAVKAPVMKEAVVNTEALAALLRAKVPVTLLDARTGKYDDGRRIPGAKTLSPRPRMRK